MNQIDFDPVFSAAVRNELDARVSAPTSRAPFWRRHVRLGIGVFAGASILIGGGAAAAGLLTMPGAKEVTELGTTIVATNTGSAVVQLGAAPDGATNVFVSLTCLTYGTFTFNDGASISCGVGDVGERSGVGSHSLTLPQQQSITITTAPESRWSITATYVSARTTDWAINGNGDTYGAINESGEPDLILVVATNRKEGYVKKADLDMANGTIAQKSFKTPADALKWQETEGHKDHTITVFNADGTTAIGEFLIVGQASQTTNK
jgi:hypothetical protein